MTPYSMTIINSIVLLAMGAWGYFATQSSPTALIAPACGLIFLLASPMFKKGNKAVVHIVVLLTLILLIALSMPLRKAISSGEAIRIFRVAMMFFTTLVAFIVYIKSFIDARKNRA